MVYATTARERGQGKPVLVPSEAMPSRRRAFCGTERTGSCSAQSGPASTTTISCLADAIVTFPVDANYGSLNLAQAVLLVGYEWLRAAHPSWRAPSHRPSGPRRPARHDLLSFFDYLEGELTKAGYFRPEDKAPIMRRNLRNIFQQIALTEQDVRTLRGAVVRLVEGRRLPGRRKGLRGAEPDPGH